MIFWDATAIVPLLVDEPATARARELLSGDHEMVVWWGAATECESALMRAHRGGRIPQSDAKSARDLLDGLQLAWYEMQPTGLLRAQAGRLLRIHPLRAADALQLAAALEWAGSPPSGAMVTFDERLREAAVKEGLETP
jgi:uncharacterized protein